MASFGGGPGKERGVRHGVRRLFRIAVRRPALTERDIDAEIEYHLERRAEELAARGYSPNEAAAEARRRFGQPSVARAQLVASAQHRENVMQLRERVSSLAADVRLALRGFGRQPAFVFVAVATLAVGIGANATVFTWMNDLVLNPLPLVPNASRLVTLATGTAGGGTQSVSYPDYLDWSAASQALRDVVAYRRQQLSLRTSAAADAQPVWGVLASSNYFTVLGLRALRGRTFRPDESAPLAGAGGAPVVVIGYNLWQRAFGGASDVIGKPLWLNGHQLEIIGILPAGFHGTDVGFGFDLWAPLTMQPTLLAQPPAKLTWRASRWMTAFATLAPGVTLSQARAELQQVGARLAQAHPEDKSLAPVIAPLFDGGASAVLKPALVALLGAGLVLLLIVSFNLASLQLVRAAAREQEVGVRLALGASRGRIVQQFLIEASLLALIGVPAALGVAYLSRGFLVQFLAHSTFPLAGTPALSAPVFAFAAAVGAAVVLLVGVWPAVRVARDARLGLGGGNRSVTGHGRAREVLVVAQLALSLVGVASAGLLIHSLERLRAADTGLADPGHVLLATSDFDLAGGSYAGFGDSPQVRARRLSSAMEILRRARALPSVRSAALMDSPPLGLVSGYDGFNVQIPGYASRRNETQSFEICYATPDYFSVVGPPIVRGRGFDDTDKRDGKLAVVINEAFARRFWRGGDPSAAAIGKEVLIGSRGTPAVVIGVVRNGKYHSLSEDSQPFIYLAYEQWSPSALTVALRTSGNPLALTEPLRRIFHEVDPALPFLDPRTLADQVNGALTLQRLGAALLTCLGTLALLIAGLGLYGVLVQAVQQRQREIGIRMAVGASAANVLRQFLMRGMLLASLGVILGIPGVLLVGRLLRGQVFGVGTVDPVALGGTALVFGAVAAVASVITAARAARVDPATSLRAE